MSVYIFSNIKTLHRIENIQEADLLVFLNTAVEYQKYKQLKCRKIVFHRWLQCKNGYAGRIIDDIENFYIFGQKNTINQHDIEEINSNYDYNYVNKVQKSPTTGFIVYSLCKKKYPEQKIFLVNFFPTQDHSTLHVSCHNWKYQDTYYKKEGVSIIDTRYADFLVGMKGSKQALYTELYNSRSDYGTDSHRFFDLVRTLMLQGGYKSILDYGCGKATLYKKFVQNNIKIDFDNYDFAIKQYSELPKRRYDLLLCLDVLQHIPEFELTKTLQELRSLSPNILFSISCRKAINRLPNGQNAHCTVHSASWWKELLAGTFDIVQEFEYRKNQLVCLVRAKEMV